MLIEVIGPDSAWKALVLKKKLSEVLKNEAQITRPVVRGEIRLIGLDASTTSAEVRDVVVSCGGCLEEDIRVGIIRSMANGLFTVWVQCPLSAAVKIANYGNYGRPLGLIYWELDLPSVLDAGNLVTLDTTANRKRIIAACFRCGGSGHAARYCNVPPNCKVCSVAGRASNHRLGSNFCPAVKNLAGKKETVSVAGPSSTVSARGTEPMIIADES